MSSRGRHGPNGTERDLRSPMAETSHGRSVTVAGIGDGDGFEPTEQKEMPGSRGQVWFRVATRCLYVVVTDAFVDRGALYVGVRRLGAVPRKPDADYRLTVALGDPSWLRVANSPAAPSFEVAWARKEREGYQYGEDALQGVRLGWEMRESYIDPKRGAP